MPQFHPEHTPRNLDNFTRGYLEAAEWLLDEDVNRSKIRGFTPKAVKLAKTECLKFQMDNAVDLEAFCQATGRELDLAGYCFWMDRNGTGTGFWDRDAGKVGDRLSRASKAYGTCDTDVYRGRIYLMSYVTDLHITQTESLAYPVLYVGHPSDDTKRG
jgi:hypothetical protein